jgi:structure-specific endonuclease subunit SLX1
MDTQTAPAAATETPRRWFVYLLSCSPTGTGGTYVGMTFDLDRRLKQHNGQVAGGAAATRGRSWFRVCHVEGFPDQTAALQFEWAWKHRTRRAALAATPLQRRLRALQALLADSRPTSKALPYSEYPAPLECIWDATDIPMPPL